MRVYRYLLDGLIFGTMLVVSSTAMLVTHLEHKITKKY